MNLPWADKVPAILVSWLTGEEGPDALAPPSSLATPPPRPPAGELPPGPRNEDNPASPTIRAATSADYGEGLFVGYRHFDRAGARLSTPSATASPTPPSPTRAWLAPATARAARGSRRR